jgi:hypothetical protein
LSSLWGVKINEQENPDYQEYKKSKKRLDEIAIAINAI